MLDHAFVSTGAGATLAISGMSYGDLDEPFNG